MSNITIVDLMDLADEKDFSYTIGDGSIVLAPFPIGEVREFTNLQEAYDFLVKQ